MNLYLPSLVVAVATISQLYLHPEVGGAAERKADTKYSNTNRNGH